MKAFNRQTATQPSATTTSSTTRTTSTTTTAEQKIRLSTCLN